MYLCTECWVWEWFADFECEEKLEINPICLEVEE